MKTKHLIFALSLFLTAGTLKAEISTAPLTTPSIPTFQIPRAAIYLGVVIPRNGVGGDFDGNRFYASSDFVTTVPSVSNNWGMGVTVGVKARTASSLGVAFEGSLVTSKHDTDFAGRAGEGRYTALNGDIKLFPISESRVQPFFLLGFSLPFVEIKQGFVNANETKDATYSGFGLSGGVGLEAYLTQRVALNGAIVYRRQTFNNVQYGGSNSRLNEELTSSKVTFQIGANYYFKLW